LQSVIFHENLGCDKRQIQEGEQICDEPTIIATPNSRAKYEKKAAFTG